MRTLKAVLAAAGLLFVAWPAAAQQPAAAGTPASVALIYTGRSLGALGVLRDVHEQELVIEEAQRAGLPLRFSTFRCWRAPGVTLFSPDHDLSLETLVSFLATVSAPVRSIERPALRSNNATLVQDAATAAPDLVAMARGNPRAARDFPDLVGASVRVATVTVARAPLMLVLEDQESWPADRDQWTVGEVSTIDAGGARLYELAVNLSELGPRATLVRRAQDQARANGATPLTIDLGHRDGDLGLERLDRARVDYRALHELGYSIVVPYELELALGASALKTLRDGYPDLTLLAANVKTVKASNDLLRARTIVDVGGVKVGLFGLVDPNLRSVMSHDALADFAFEAPLVAAARETAALRAAGAQAVIALSNLHPVDNALVSREVAGIDAIIADLHVRWSPESVTTSVELPDRPFVRPGSPALVARGFANGLGVGRLDLTFARRESGAAFLKSIVHSLVSVTDRTPADAALVRQVRAQAAAGERPRGPVLLPSFESLVAARPALASYDATTALGRVSKPMWEEFLARLLRRDAGAEVAVIRKLPNFPPVMGALHEADVRAWLWTEDCIVVADMLGSDLSGLLAADTAGDLVTSGIDRRAGTVNGRAIGGAIYYRVATTDVIFEGARSGAFAGARHVSRVFIHRDDGRLDASGRGASLRLRTIVLDELTRLQTTTPAADYADRVARLFDRDVPFEPLFTFTFDRPTLFGSLTRSVNRTGFDHIPESRVLADDSLVLGVTGRYVLSYDRRRLGLDFGAETDYGHQSGMHNGSKFVIENQDDLLFDVRARRKPAQANGRAPQPFLRLVYDTEFTPTVNTATGVANARQQLLRAAGGVLLTSGGGWRSVEIGAIAESNLATGSLRSGVQIRTDFQRRLGGAGRPSYRWRNDAAWFLPASDDTNAELGLKYSMIHELLIPLVDEFSLSIGADFFIYRGKVPETRRVGVNTIFRIGLTYDRLWKPRYQPLF